MLHNSGGRSGLEPTEVSSKKLATRVSQVLMDFKNKIEKATQVEKCLLFERTISRINFSKESLEVIVSLKDTTSPLSDSRNSLVLSRMAVGSRGGAVNPDAPACSTGLLLLNGSLARTRTWDMFVNSEPLYQLSYQGKICFANFSPQHLLEEHSKKQRTQKPCVLFWSRTGSFGNEN